MAAQEQDYSDNEAGPEPAKQVKESVFDSFWTAEEVKVKKKKRKATQALNKEKKKQKDEIDDIFESKWN